MSDTTWEAKPAPEGTPDPVLKLLKAVNAVPEGQVWAIEDISEAIDLDMDSLLANLRHVCPPNTDRAEWCVPWHRLSVKGKVVKK